jgi:23S rRNA pseudouridine2605 synthase
MERLQKIIAAAGIASRRHAEDLITAGSVTVNGKVVTELGTKADPAKDHIKVNGKLINPLIESRKNVYILLYKPKGYLTSLSDPDGRPCVSELLPTALGRLHPVGRLDFNTEGLLLLTNDGEFTNFITQARNHVAKVYAVKVKGVPPEVSIERLRRGVRLDDGVKTAPAEIKLMDQSDTNAWYEVVLHEGRNQQIRKMFDVIAHSVLKLKRVQIGTLRDEILRPKQWRFLSEVEVARLLRSGKPKKPRVATSKTTRVPRRAPRA